ncbi:7-carboxy-7-deazaguanine synthase QueE [Hyperthermus butylicus]|uniref:7-carboxy-7-deazaguanine synthase n=1 Tax=Hyperthermus butylicus (strain DSM 5456 / JCM 9403 / PLM1-5) TaxID=415426 RepID=QUEE_HYPBU|nr:7-carboxy-7-deazaguanine synthase QueE [Hyperthermus butylicus]A2BJ90.1 RecName: Full=7-carboxy-7-deazaguanine synthase; Short=CDG synthase; AltName: Full=Archaeosine biosynthesis protein QueE [Hyperthermus butylicus DSM 5456]ABM80051.1 Organic radical activating enzyme, NrdG [Hyperthermus butylicus DSM 5456]
MSRSARRKTSALNTVLRVVEVFASIQGEGPFTGTYSVFVRLAGCNLRCPFCDTRYAWSLEAGKPLGVEELVEEIARYEPSLVVITGGEPLLQRHPLNSLVEGLESLGLRVQLETNGILPAPARDEQLWRVYHVVSPKDVPVRVPGAKLHPSWVDYARATGRAWFKFLVANEQHVREVAEYVAKLGIPRSRVYIMPLTPEKLDMKELLELHSRIASLAVKWRLNFSPRLHLLVQLP